MANKGDEFREAVIKFKNSKQTYEDYFSFLISYSMSTKQGSGICFGQVESILKEVIDEEK